MSTKTGRAPTITIVVAEATNENAGVRTSSPGPTPSAASARRSASVPEATPTAWRTPCLAASAASSALPSSPSTNRLESRTRAAAASRSPRRAAGCRVRSKNGIISGARLRDLDELGDDRLAAIVPRPDVRGHARHAHRHVGREQLDGPVLDAVARGAPEGDPRARLHEQVARDVAPPVVLDVVRVPDPEAREVEARGLARLLGLRPGAQAVRHRVLEPVRLGHAV